MANHVNRQYRSASRTAGAERTRAKLLAAGMYLFSRKGIDATTIAEIAQRAGVAPATVYATVKSKAGLLQALMHDAIFGPRFHAAQRQLEGVRDATQRIALTAHVARAIYEGEGAELGLLMKASAFSPELRKTQHNFERVRREMQASRIDALFSEGCARKGLNRQTAADLLWMYTGRDVYHKLVHECGWSPDRYQAWLQETLLRSLTNAPDANPR